jgi:hypothetical protein
VKGKNVFATTGGIIAVGIFIGLAAILLQKLGNPANMGICVACFERDIAGGLGLHRAGIVQYIRPEIIGLVLGSLGAALMSGEFRPRGGSSPLVRFVIGMIAAMGALVFLGCPWRAVLRLAGGDFNAILEGEEAVAGHHRTLKSAGSGVFLLELGNRLLNSTYAILLACSDAEGLTVFDDDHTIGTDTDVDVPGEKHIKFLLFGRLDLRDLIAAAAVASGSLAEIFDRTHRCRERRGDDERTVCQDLDGVVRGVRLSGITGKVCRISAFDYTDMLIEFVGLSIIEDSESLI